MSKEVNRALALKGWLAAFADKGWRGADAIAAADAAGMAHGALLALLCDRLDAVAAWQDRVADAAALAAGAGAGSARDRLFDGMMAGFDAVQADRAAALALWHARDPALAASIVGRAGRGLRRLARAAGVAEGLDLPLRLAVLGGVAARALRVWASDESADMAAVMASLDGDLARVEDWAKRAVSFPGIAAIRPADDPPGE
ncbi:hypothetical protein [Sandaracinobacteroides saxicola]|uniref:Uncharacterized protein n=1 Tax=Sandaracinobacteroides saxicola TaxID=2759707 RepID=A0A7G5IKR8_9SPHN|nr:hypothetical protein [Sandaracinobacteroides saxicola]QMW23960.1 hypothetical protein H3309_05690 [Sandaracinobacteroides saxicola]